MNGSISLFDFIVSLAESVISPTGKQETPYDINFTNLSIDTYRYGLTAKKDNYGANITNMKTLLFAPEVNIASALLTDSSEKVLGSILNKSAETE